MQDYRPIYYSAARCLLCSDRENFFFIHAEAMLIEYNGKKKSPAQRLSINKLHARESSIFSGLEDSSVSDEDWNDDSEVEEDDL